MIDARQIEVPLTEQEILLRDHFVAQYLVDFDPYKACLRIGFQPTYATIHANTLFNDGYVQRKIAHMLTAPVVSTPEQEAADRALLENTLKRLMAKGSDSAQAAAVGKYMTLKGWDKQEGGNASEELAEAFKRMAQALPQ